MPVVGVEPTRVLTQKSFESPSSAIPTHRLIPYQNSNIIIYFCRKIKPEKYFFQNGPISGQLRFFRVY